MSKSTAREFNVISMYAQLGMIDTAARAASALIRCQLRQSVKDQLMQAYKEWPEMLAHPEFIV
jgi:hypothetical protein